MIPLPPVSWRLAATGHREEAPTCAKLLAEPEPQVPDVQNLRQQLQRRRR